MKDLNLLAYVLGSAIGVTFILGIFLGSKKVDKQTILYQFKHRLDRYFTYLFNIVMAIILLTSIKFFIDGVWSNYKLWLAMSYWLSIAFILCYVMTRKLIVTKEGIGYMDMFGRKGNLDYSWKKVKKYEVSEKLLTVTLAEPAKPIVFKIKLSSEDIEKAKTAIKLAMK
jgi:hypothetical protein